MATNENLPPTLVANLIAAGYTPRTPEEWIFSAIDYLHQNAVTPSPPGAATWGSIAGTLSSQTDLNTALGLKAPAASPVFTGVVSLPAGAVGAPSLARTGALTTGIFFPSATEGAFTSSGAIVGGWNATGLFTNIINEQVATSGIIFTGAGGDILATGILRGTALHNNALAQGDDTEQDIRSGTYTPTYTAGTNVATATGTDAKWIRVGNVVYVSGRFTADPTLTATASALTISLPVVTNFGGASELSGGAFCGNIAAMGAEIITSGATNAQVNWVASDVGNQTWSYWFSYLILP